MIVLTMMILISAGVVYQSIIQPPVVGQTMSLSRTITFFSVLFWAVVIGPIGGILAVPLTLIGKAMPPG